MDRGFRPWSPDEPDSSLHDNRDNLAARVVSKSSTCLQHVRRHWPLPEGSLESRSCLAECQRKAWSPHWTKQVHATQIAEETQRFVNDRLRQNITTWSHRRRRRETTIWSAKATPTVTFFPDRRFQSAAIVGPLFRPSRKSWRCADGRSRWLAAFVAGPYLLIPEPRRGSI